MQKIVIDIYGADRGPEIVLKGIAKAFSCDIDFFPILVGEKTLIKSFLSSRGIEDNKYEIIDTNDFISADEPATAIFTGRNSSSLALAYDFLKKDDQCTALLTAGNTGAVLVGSIFRLGLLPPLKSPALASALPCCGEKLLCLIDCGANVSPTAKELSLFAMMGNVFCSCFCGVENPRIGIMSVGREVGKGNALTLEAYKLMQNLPINFIGNLEGCDMVSGEADVIVADGFTGNILLKNTEATAMAALKAIEQLELNEDALRQIRNVIYKKFDFNSRGAATFLGTKKAVVKMHGCANADTVVASIDQILRLNKSNFIEKLKKELENFNK